MNSASACQRLEDDFGIKLKPDWVHSSLLELCTVNAVPQSDLGRQLQLLFERFLTSDLKLVGAGSLPADLKVPSSLKCQAQLRRTKVF